MKPGDVLPLRGQITVTWRGKETSGSASYSPPKGMQFVVLLLDVRPKDAERLKADDVLHAWGWASPEDVDRYEAKIKALEAKLPKPAEETDR